MHCSDSEVSEDKFSVELDDCIGVESCMDLMNDLSFLDKKQSNNIVLINNNNNNNNNNCCKKSSEKITRMMMMMKKTTMMKMENHPPPISWLGERRTHENCYFQMPWVMKKYQFDDGRLIIREEKVDGRRREYFQAHRSDGRLTLHLVPLTDYHFPSSHSDSDSDGDDAVDAEVTTTTTIENQNRSPKTEEEEEEEEEEEIMPTTLSSTDNDDDQTSVVDRCGGGGGGGAVDGEYYNSCVRRNSTVLGTALPVLSSVHT